MVMVTLDIVSAWATSDGKMRDATFNEMWWFVGYWNSETVNVNTTHEMNRILKKPQSLM